MKEQLQQALAEGEMINGSSHITATTTTSTTQVGALRGRTSRSSYMVNNQTLEQIMKKANDIILKSKIACANSVNTYASIASAASELASNCTTAESTKAKQLEHSLERVGCRQESINASSPPYHEMIGGGCSSILEQLSSSSVAPISYSSPADELFDNFDSLFQVAFVKQEEVQPAFSSSPPSSSSFIRQLFPVFESFHTEDLRSSHRQRSSSLQISSSCTTSNAFQSSYLVPKQVQQTTISNQPISLDKPAYYNLDSSNPPPIPQQIRPRNTQPMLTLPPQPPSSQVPQNKLPHRQARLLSYTLPGSCNKENSSDQANQGNNKPFIISTPIGVAQHKCESPLVPLQPPYLQGSSHQRSSSLSSNFQFQTPQIQLLNSRRGDSPSQAVPRIQQLIQQDTVAAGRSNSLFQQSPGVYRGLSARVPQYSPSPCGITLLGNSHRYSSTTINQTVEPIPLNKQIATSVANPHSILNAFG